MYSQKLMNESTRTNECDAKTDCITPSDICATINELLECDETNAMQNLLRASFICGNGLAEHKSAQVSSHPCEIRVIGLLNALFQPDSCGIGKLALIVDNETGVILECVETKTLSL